MTVRLGQINQVTTLDPKTTPFFPFVVPVPSVSVVIPTKNEAKNLPHVLTKIPAMVDEVVLVDGNSNDGTVEVARSLYPDINIVMQKGRGKGNALREGFAAAAGDIIIMLDADGSMAPEEIPTFVNALLSGADYVKGSRFLEGGGTDDMEYHRYLGNLGFVLLVRLLFGAAYTDLCYGYCAFWSRVLPALQLSSDGFEIETEINIRAIVAGLQITEVPSFEYKRIHGVSNLNAVRDGTRVLHMILKQGFVDNSANAVSMNVTKDEFGPAMELLFQEAAHLMRRRASLSSITYQRSVEAIKAASKSLLSMECNDPQVCHQQEIYRRRGDRLWSFLDPVREVTTH